MQPSFLQTISPWVAPALVFVTALLITVVGLALLYRHKQHTWNERKDVLRRDGFDENLKGGINLKAVIKQATKTNRGCYDLAMALEDAPAKNVELLQKLPETKALIDKRLHSRRATMRGHAAFLCGTLKVEGTEDALSGLLRDEDPDVQYSAALALSKFQTQVAAVHLIEAVGDNLLPSELIVEHLCFSWAAPYLVSSYPGAEENVKPWILEALGLCDEGELAAPTIVYALQEGNVEERIRAARALGRLDVQISSPYLIEALSDDEWAVRAQAAKSLGLLKSQQALMHLREGLCDSAWWVRANCGAALRELGSSGIAQLQNALDDDDKYARERAQEELAMYNAAQTVHIKDITVETENTQVAHAS